MSFQNINNRPVNYVRLIYYSPPDCKKEEGEYDLQILGFLGALDLQQPGGNDDVTLIKECFEENIDEFPDDTPVDIILKESGEWEDVFWNKYYVVERWCELEK